MNIHGKTTYCDNAKRNMIHYQMIELSNYELPLMRDTFATEIFMFNGILIEDSRNLSVIITSVQQSRNASDKKLLLRNTPFKAKLECI